jgi:hypothetical protein
MIAGLKTQTESLVQDALHELNKTTECCSTLPPPHIYISRKQGQKESHCLPALLEIGG